MNYRSVLNFNKKSNVQLEYDDINVKLNSATNTNNETGVVTDLLQGGSGDFSTAVMTINDPDGQGWLIIGAFVLDRGSDSTIYPQIYSDEEESIQIALYKGKSVIAFPNDNAAEITVTGNAVNDGDYITVTGECAITLPSIG